MTGVGAGGEPAAAWWEPPADVLDAFGATGEPRRLPGGEGRTWRAGDVILKPAEGAATRWRCAILADLPESAAFRVARPLRSRDGHWIHGGWEAMRAVAGRPDPARVGAVLAAGTAFHAAVAAVPRPSFLDDRRDPWAYADRLAWNEPLPPGAVGPSGLLASLPPGTVGPSGLLASLLAARRPVDLPAQIVHGDLAGNVLFAAGRPPAVIDWAPYWRPPGWACAIAVIDAACWFGAGPEAFGRGRVWPAWDQMLIRALIFRVATSKIAGQVEPASMYRRVADGVFAFRDAAERVR